MATVDKLFSFQTTAEGLVDGGATAATFAWQSGDSQTGSGGCVKVTTTSKGLAIFQPAILASQTWEGWGVPAGETVTAVQLVSWYYRVVANSKLNNWVVNYIFVPASGSSISVGSQTPPNTLSSWTAGNVLGAPVSLAVSQASNLSFEFDIHFDVTTDGGGGSANVDVRVDELLFRITYGGATATDPFGTMGIFGI